MTGVSVSLSCFTSHVGMRSSWHVLDGTLVSRSITSSVTTGSNWENDGVLRGTITAGGTAEVGDRMSETLLMKKDAKSSALWPIEEDGTGGRSSTIITLNHVSFRRYRPLKLPLSCEVVKKWFWVPDLYRGGYTQISDIHFQIALTSEHLAGFDFFAKVKVTYAIYHLRLFWAVPCTITSL